MCLFTHLALWLGHEGSEPCIMYQIYTQQTGLPPFSSFGEIYLTSDTC